MNVNARVLEALEKWGFDAMSFLALEPAMHHFWDDEGELATFACVAYADTGASWVAASAPLGEPRDVPVIAERFVRAAKAAGRRASFFATESMSVADFSRVRLGQQPVFRPRLWLEQLDGRRKLKEQLRRARAKGVSARLVTAQELDVGTELRTRVDGLAEAWLDARPMAPMQFLVSLEPFVAPERHLYFVAERDGELCAFLSAVPVPRRNGWLVEDVVRAIDAPNGTTPLLLHALMAHVAETSDFVTLGLTPLAGDVSLAMRVVGALGTTFFDFDGLRAFRERLGPHHWQSVWMLHPRGAPSFVHLLDGLHAFAGGSLVRFAARSALRHPGGPPWLLAIPLLPWTLALLGIVATGHSAWLGFHASELAAWSVFDIVMVALLFRVAARPTLPALTVAALASLLDAALSVVHLRAAGVGDAALEQGLRAVATAAPCVAVLLLAWALARAWATRARPLATAPRKGRKREPA